MKLDVQYREYGEAVAAFIRERGLTTSKALRSEGRHLATRLIRLTPPRTLSQGRKAVARDIQRAVRPLRAADFESRRIRQLIRKRDHAGLEAVFRNFPEKSPLHGVSVVQPRFPEMHEQARASRGRVHRFQRRVTPDVDVVRDYIKRVQERVGRGRGGWAVSLLALGGNTQAWVVRHAKTDTGAFEERSDVTSYVRMENRSEWAEAGDEDRIVANAIRSRTQNILTAIAKAQEEALRRAQLQ